MTGWTSRTYTIPAASASQATVIARRPMWAGKGWYPVGTPEPSRWTKGFYSVHMHRAGRVHRNCPVIR